MRSVDPTIIFGKHRGGSRADIVRHPGAPQRRAAGDNAYLLATIADAPRSLMISAAT